jgi:hypothetical protein
LGHRIKIAKFLMRTFTCRSTFLYGEEALIQENNSCNLNGGKVIDETGEDRHRGIAFAA